MFISILHISVSLFASPQLHSLSELGYGTPSVESADVIRQADMIGKNSKWPDNLYIGSIIKYAYNDLSMWHNIGVCFCLESVKSSYYN